MKDDFHRLDIIEEKAETRNAVSIGFAVPPELAEAFRFKPGQHIGVRATIGGEEVRRTYSISSGPSDRLLWITIKRVGDGLFSDWAHSNLRAGGVLDCMAPAGRLVVPPPAENSLRRIVAVAAGSGITPIVSIIEHVLANESRASVSLIYGNRTVDDIIFRERLEALKNRHLERFQVFHVLSRDSEAEVPLLSGRIDAEKVSKLVGRAPIEPDDEFLLCGPDTLIKEARDALLGMGAARERVRFEYFRAGAQPATPAVRRSSVADATIANAGAEVIAILDGSRRTFRVRQGEHIVDAGLAAGVKLPYSCKGGMCCTCRAMLVEGKVEMDRNFSLQDWETEAGFVLTCQSRPVTARVLLDYDRS